MKKTLLVLALSLPIVSSSVTAFKVGSVRQVFVDGKPMGTMTARNRVADNGSTCRYALQWSHVQGGLNRTVRCDVLERKSSNAFDCSVNSTRWVTTLVERDPAGACSGFDTFGRMTRITSLRMAETSSGASGVFYAQSIGNSMSIEID